MTLRRDNPDWSVGPTRYHEEVSGRPAHDLLYDPNELGADWVVECWISQGPRATDATLDSQAMANLGVLYERAGREADAVAAYQAAIDSGHPDQAPRAMVNLGYLHERAGREADAVAAYQAAIDSGHHDQAPKAMVSVGVLLYRNGSREEAHEHWDRALESATIWVLVSIAPVLAVEGDLERARGLLAEAEAVGCVEAADYRMVLHEDIDEARAAKARLAVAAQAGDSDAMNALGILAHRQGDANSARLWWQRSSAAGDVAGPLLLQWGEPPP